MANSKHNEQRVIAEWMREKGRTGLRSHGLECLNGLVAADADPLTRLGKVKIPQTRFSSIPLVRSTEKVEIIFCFRDQYIGSTRWSRGELEGENSAPTVEGTVVPSEARVPDHDPFVGGLPVVISSPIKVCLYWKRRRREVQG